MVKETDANGQITFDNLYLGNYYLQELKTDAKYRLNSRKYSINLEDENKEEVVKTITIQNFLQKGNIIITKTSSLTKENLSNADFFAMFFNNYFTLFPFIIKCSLINKGIIIFSFYIIFI